jgi:hypothetical protein
MAQPRCELLRQALGLGGAALAAGGLGANPASSILMRWPADSGPGRPCWPVLIRAWHPSGCLTGPWGAV